MDDDFGQIFDQNINIPCTVCGQMDYYLEDGYYFCGECKTQSQELMLYVSQEVFSSSMPLSAATSKLKETRPTGPQYHIPTKGVMRTLSTWEMYNLVIRSMADTLLKLGFPSILKDKIFQLWTAFLIRKKVIFVSTEEEKVSRASHGENEVNLKVFYNRETNGQIARRKRRIKAKNRKEEIKNNEEDFSEIPSSYQKRASVKAKSFSKEYLEQAKQLASSTTAFDELLEKEKTEENVEIPLKQRRLEFTEETALAYKILPRKLNNRYVGHIHPQEHRKMLEVFSPTHFNMNTLFILIYVACRQIGCKILFSDIRRLYADGTLYIENIDGFFTENERKDLPNSLNMLFKCSNILSGGLEILNRIKAFKFYLNIQSAEVYEFEYYLPKIIKDFALPKEFELLVMQLYRMIPMKECLKDIPTTAKTWGEYSELWAVAYVFVVLKMLFGLDDLTEKHQSSFAITFNNTLTNFYKNNNSLKPEEKDWLELFDIEEWFAYIRFRHGLYFHELFNPAMYRPNFSYSFNKMCHLQRKYSGQRVQMVRNKHRYPRIHENGLKIKAMFSSLINEVAIKEDLAPCPNYSTIGLPFENFANQFKNAKPAVCYKEFQIEKVKSNFEKKRIDFIFNPFKYLKLIESSGVRVKIHNGDALNVNFNDISNEETNQIVHLFRPYKYFDDYIEKSDTCSDSMKFLLRITSHCINGSYDDDGIKYLIIKFMKELGNMYCKRCLGGFVPLHYSNSRFKKNY